MSQDMMQALAGSSLLSLSVGTLPAVKSGMMLDANPFASQLALMTGPDAATSDVGGTVATLPFAADGSFALALAQVPVPPAGSPIGSPALAAEIPALPEDASPSQIIEAVLGSAATTDSTPDAALAAANAAPAPKNPAAIATPQPVQQPVEAPVLRRIAPQALPEAVDVQDIAAKPHGPRPHRAGKHDEPVAGAADAVPVAPAIIDAVTPAAIRLDAYAPETGNERVAVSAKPSPVAETLPATNADGAATGTAPVAATAQPPAQPGPDVASVRPDPTSGQPVPQPAEARRAHAARPAQHGVVPTAPGSAATGTTEISLTPQAQPASSAFAAASPLAQPAQTAPSVAPSLVQPEASSAQPAPLVTQPASSVPLPAALPAQPALSATEPAASLPQAETPVLHTARAAVSPVPSASHANAASPALTNVAKGPETAAQLPQTPDVMAPAEVVLPSQIPPQPQRAAATPAAPRMTAPSAVQRLVQAASLSARPAQALGALLDLADPAAQPVAAAALLDTPGPVPTETIPPSWAAALNAVLPPAGVNSAQGLAVPAATGPVPAAPLESLAFDAGFIGNVETQIARVMGGSQMVRMQIMPEHLGRIDIEMLAGPERDQVRIVTEHNAVRDTLVQSQVRLEQDLRNNGNRNTEVTVELRQQSAGTQGGSAQQQRGQSGQETGAGRESIPRQTTADTIRESATPRPRPRGNVRYA